MPLQPHGRSRAEPPARRRAERASPPGVGWDRRGPAG